MYKLYENNDYCEIVHHIEPLVYKKTIRLPFQVPEGVEGVHIGFFSNNRAHNKINWMVNGIDRNIGRSNRLRRTVYISEDCTSEGFKSCKIKSGEWAVVICPITIGKASTIRIRIRYKMKNKTWYRGDLHMHTIHSDGAFSVDEVIQHIREENLDFMALTDHNSFTQNFDFTPPRDLVVIPGVEYSTPNGDTNFWGLKEPYNTFRDGSEENVKAIIEEAKGNGALVSMNHPFNNNKPWVWKYSDFQFIEIWRGEWNEYNQRAVQYWHDRLVAGEHIIGVGGSDIHDENQGRWYGLPTTVVQAKAFNIRGILAGIENGRVCVTSGPNAPIVDLKIGDTRMGECLDQDAIDERLPIICTLSKPCEGILKLYSSEGLEYETILDGLEDEIELPRRKETLFYRVEIWGMEQDIEENCSNSLTPICFSNPIFINTYK